MSEIAGCVVLLLTSLGCGLWVCVWGAEARSVTRQRYVDAEYEQGDDDGGYDGAYDGDDAGLGDGDDDADDDAAAYEDDNDDDNGVRRGQGRRGRGGRER